jgi:capsular polysaccharide biosynthesis protein
MRPEEYLRIVLRRWWLIPLIALVAAAVAYLYTAGQPSVYTSSTTLSVSAEPLDQSNDIAAKNRLAPLKAIIGGGEVLSRAAGRPEMQARGLDAGTIGSKLALAHSPDTNTIQIAATDGDPRVAADVVNAVAAAFIVYVNENNAKLVQEFPRFTVDGTPIVLPNGQLAPIIRLNIAQLGMAGPAAEPSAPRPKLNAAAGAILGVAIALVIAFALEYLDDTLRTPEEVRRHLGLTVLGGVPKRVVSRKS